MTIIAANGPSPDAAHSNETIQGLRRSHGLQGLSGFVAMSIKLSFAVKFQVDRKIDAKLLNLSNDDLSNHAYMPQYGKDF